MTSKTKKRIDLLLVEKGVFPSREKAQRAIMAGVVFYRGNRIDKPGTLVEQEGQLEVKGNPCPFVSRGGIKLETALKEFGAEVTGKVALDAGASTGGFTQCLLKYGAKKVYAVDVGYGQLSWELRQDPRVIVFEKTNIRYLTHEDLGERVDFVTLDLSFISVEKVFNAVRDLLNIGGEIIVLVKPQFEAGREHIEKGGIVKEPGVHVQVLEQVIQAAKGFGFNVKGLTHSPILGGDGNIEFFLWLGMGSSGINVTHHLILDVVKNAHAIFSKSSQSAECQNAREEK